MKIAIVQFPGSNGERETMLAVKRAGMEPVEFLWNESPEKLQIMDGFVIVSGFSFADHSRAGIIAALHPLMQTLALQSELGKPILGIGNGAQILVESGLVPGLQNNKVGMAFAKNKRVIDGRIIGTGYYNAWVHIRLSDQYQRNAFTSHLTPKNVMSIPVTHGEGRFLAPPALLQEIEMQGLNVFQYCDAEGKVIDAYPVNPNGSMCNIAAVANKKGNVLAMMPHPERVAAGDAIFQSMRDYIKAGHHEEVAPLHYYPRQAPRLNYQKPSHAYELVVELTPVDPHAQTVQETLQRLGFSVTVKRKIHFEIHCDDVKTMEAIKASKLLINEGKVVEKVELPNSFLVRSKDDLLGQQALQSLRAYSSIENVSAIYQGELWQFNAEKAVTSELMNEIMLTNVICNPCAQDCYKYS